MGLLDKFRKNKMPQNPVKNEYKKNLETDSGMWALWDYAAYQSVDDYDKWEPLFCEDEDIEQQIVQKSFVPIYIFEDGCRSFTLKIDEELSEREQAYLEETSEEYLFYSNGKAVLSGIDLIHRDVSQDEAILFDLPKGYYKVTICLIRWDEEPGACLEDGEASPDALSDFVVLLKHGVDIGKAYRQKINTFSKDD